MSTRPFGLFARLVVALLVSGSVAWQQDALADFPAKAMAMALRRNYASSKYVTQTLSSQPAPRNSDLSVRY